MKSWQILEQLMEHPYLIVPQRLRDDIGSHFELPFINGCGANSGLFKDMAPTTIDGICIKAACIVHDAEYLYGQTLADKAEADMNILINMLLIIKHAPDNGKITESQRQARVESAYLIFRFVHEYGLKSFVEEKDIAVRDMTFTEQTMLNINLVRHAFGIPLTLLKDAIAAKMVSLPKSVSLK